MNKVVKTDRLVVLSVLLMIILCVYFVFLYKLQVVEGASYAEKSANSIASIQSVTAARGNLLDRYGRVLVSNVPCYNLTINEHQLFYETDDPNAVILDVVNTVRAHGDEYNDDLPITTEPPYEYTELSDVRQLQLSGYLEKHGLSPNTTAVELMSYFRTRYKISNSYSAEDMRTIAGVRYSINMRYSVNTSSYVFVEDASIDLITTLLEKSVSVVNVQTSFVREYSTKYAANILGYTGLMTAEDYEKYKSMNYSFDAKVGKEGAELAFENYLHGTDGLATITTTADGTVTDTVYSTEPIPGNNVYLTIDESLQEATEQALATNIEQMAKSREENLKAEGKELTATNTISGGAAVVVDVKTGEPLAIASYPTYDLSRISDIAYYKEKSEDKNAPFLNRALSGQYAPGSTFKPCTAIAALTEGTINTGSVIRCDGVFQKYADINYAPVCWIWSQFHLTHGNESVTTAIRDSCNIFFYTLGDELGIDKLDKYAYDFGLGKATGIELPEKTGNMANKETHKEIQGVDWYSGDSVQAAIGQSDSLFTPLQMAEYCAAIANSGQRHTASILKMVRSYDYSNTIYTREAEVLSSVETTESNWKAVQQGMYLVASDPNGSAYGTFGHYRIKVAAKTGTAQTGADNTANGMFICYAPYDDPQIAVAVSIEHAGAGASLAPVAKQILDAYFTSKGSTEKVEGELILLK